MNCIIARITSSNTIFTMHDSADVMLFIFEDSILITTPQRITLIKLYYFYVSI